jgi:hypothetical protein
LATSTASLTARWMSSTNRSSKSRVGGVGPGCQVSGGWVRMTAPSTERNFPTPEFACQPPSPRTDKGGKLEVGRQASLLVAWSLVTPPFLPRIWWPSNRSAEPRRWGLRFSLRFTHPIPRADPGRCDLRFFARRAADLNRGCATHSPLKARGMGYDLSPATRAVMLSG